MSLIRSVVLTALVVVAAFAAMVWLRVESAQDPIDAAIEAVMATGPSAAVVAIDHADSPEYRVYGTFEGVQLSGDTRFRLASLTKPVISAAILELSSRGLLSLDDPVTGILRDIAFEDPRALDVTMRDLLRHSAGFDEGATVPPLFAPPEALLNAYGLDARSQTDCRGIARAMAARPLDHPPGTRYVYSNTGYCLLGLVIEELSGAPLEAALHALVPEAAALTFDPSRLDVESVVAEGQRDWLVLRPAVAGAAGGLIGSARDYMGFLERPVSGEVAEPLPYGHDGDHFMGLGWRVWPGPGCPERTHFGSMPGAYSVAVVDGDRRLVALFAGRPPEDGPAFAAIVLGACGQFDER